MRTVGAVSLIITTMATTSSSFTFPSDTVSWGIIGVGDVCEVKSGPGFYKATGSSLAAVMRRTSDLAADFASRHGVASSYDTVDGLLGDETVNAVYIASPVGSHLEHALAACKAGKPTLLEKPMGRCAEEARLIVDAFKAANVPLWSAYYRRAHPAPQRVRHMIAAGELGKILWVQYDLSFEVSTDVERFVAAVAAADGGGGGGGGGDDDTAPSLPWRLSPSASGGGLVMDVGSHVVDLLDMLLGPLAVDASSSAASRSAAYGDVPTEDLVVMDFTCGCVGGGQQPARGQCRWDFAQPKGRGRKELLRIVGSERTVTFRPLASDGITVETTGERGTAATQWIPLPPSQHVHQNLIQSIVNELLATRQSGEGRAVAATPATAEGLGLLGLERCPSTGETGARANDHLDAVLSTFYGPRSIGFWDLESPQGTGAGTGVAVGPVSSTGF
jgi:1,5-anhydro-D-fructose reductase (1,5-anhydro-D-mannitol-forming)